MPGAKSLTEVLGRWNGQVNLDSPQAQGLKIWLPLMEPGGTPRDPVSPSTYVFTGSPNPSYGVRKEGRVLTTGAVVNQGVKGTIPSGLFPGSFTLSYWALQSAYTDGNLTLFLPGTVSNNNRIASYALSLKMRWDVFDSGGNPTTIDSDGSLSTTEIIHWVVVMANGSRLSMYANGIEQADVKTPGTRNGSGTTLYVLGDDLGDASLNGYTRDFRIYDRALSRTEVWALYDSRTRYDLCWVPRRQQYSPTAAAPVASAVALFRANAGLGAVGGGPFARANAGVGAVA